MLSEPYVQDEVQAESLYNFLCYLQSIDEISVERKKGYSLIHNFYGQYVDNIFIITQDV